MPTLARPTKNGKSRNDGEEDVSANMKISVGRCVSSAWHLWRSGNRSTARLRNLKIAGKKLGHGIAKSGQMWIG